MRRDWLKLGGARVFLSGCGGLGSSCAAGFVEAGASVVVADADADGLKSLADTLDLDRTNGGVIEADLSGPEVCRQTVEQAARKLDGLDVFVHALGINNRKPILDLDDEQWERILRINLSSAYWLGQAAGRILVEQRSGRMVFFSSVSGLLAHRHHGPYAATKGGMNQLIRVMAAEWADKGVRVNAIAPGYVETPLTQAYLAKPGIREQLESLVPAGRLGAVQDVVGPTLFLASSMSSFVTGQVLYVDGGRILV